MRKLIVIISIMFGAQSMVAQRYIQFENWAEFTVELSNWSMPSVGPPVVERSNLPQYVSFFDTIEGYSCFLVELSTGIHLHSMSVIDADVIVYEDTINDVLMGCSVDYSDSLLTKSVLIYDYNQNVGDVVNSVMLNNSSNGPFIINSIDTISYEGVPRRTFHCSASGSSNAFSIMEGLGTNQGLLTNISSGVESSELLRCASFDGVSVYFDGYCNVSIGDNHIDVQSYPNPIEDLLYVQLPENMAGIVSVVDLQGKVCHQANVNSDSQTINLASLKAGIYIMSITDVNGIIMANQKIMKQ